MIAGMVNLGKIAKVIMIAPPLVDSLHSVMTMLSTKVAKDSSPTSPRVITIPRKDGTQTIVPTEYIQGILATNPIDLYKRVADTTPTVIVNALNDELVGETSFSGITVQQIDLLADHNFTGESRKALITCVATLL